MKAVISTRTCVIWRLLTSAYLLNFDRHERASRVRLTRFDHLFRDRVLEIRIFIIGEPRLNGSRFETRLRVVFNFIISRDDKRRKILACVISLRAWHIAQILSLYQRNGTHMDIPEWMHALFIKQSIFCSNLARILTWLLAAYVDNGRYTCSCTADYLRPYVKRIQL